MRQKYHRGHLSPERVRLLNALRFDWTCADGSDEDAIHPAKQLGVDDGRNLIRIETTEDAPDSCPSSSFVSLPATYNSRLATEQRSIPTILDTSFSLHSLLHGMSFSTAWQYRDIRN